MKESEGSQRKILFAEINTINIFLIRKKYYTVYHKAIVI